MTEILVLEITSLIWDCLLSISSVTEGIKEGIKSTLIGKLFVNSFSGFAKFHFYYVYM